MSRATKSIENQLKAQLAAAAYLQRINGLLIGLKEHIDQVETDIATHTWNMCGNLYDIERKLAYILATETHPKFADDEHRAVAEVLANVDQHGEVYPKVLQGK